MDPHATAVKASTNVFTTGYLRAMWLQTESLPTTKRTMTRLKDQIRLAKKALKEARVRPDLYSENELKYMALQLARAKILLKEKQLRRKQEKGFSNELSETSNSNPRGREDDGVRGTSEQSEQPGES